MMSALNDTPAKLTPLREPTFFILLALSHQKKHGYAIMKDVQALSKGRVRLSTGTLYGALARLLDQAIIQKSAADGTEEPSPAAPRARKYYQLTQFGRRVLQAELQRLHSLLTAAHQELGAEGV
jgi:DNA-binding PadR family transcriptional regulator